MIILRSYFIACIFGIALIPFLAGSLTPCICNAATGEPSLRVGSEVEFPPFAFVDENGEAAGFSVDLIKAVSKSMGLPIVITTGSWDSRWNGLVKGQFDVLPIVAKLPERQDQIDFSLPHTETFDAFFVRNGRPIIRNFAEAQNKKIVVMLSDAAHHELLEQKFKGELTLVDTIPEGLKLITSGHYDAFLCSKLIGVLTIKKYGIKGLKDGPPITDYKRVFAFGVKKGADELREKLNQGLLIVKSNGEYDQIYEKWLGFDDPWRKYKRYFLIAIVVLGVIAVAAVFWMTMLRLQVKKRTAELAIKNEVLEQEIAVRKSTEEELRSYKENLEKLVEERTRTLRASEERYRSFIEVTGELGWTTNADGEVTEDLSSWRKYTGQTYGEIKGRGWAKALHPDDLEHVLQKWAKAVAKKSTYEVEYRIRRHDGVYRYFMVRGIPLFKADGGIREWVGTCIDITERKRTEDELLRSREDMDRAQAVGNIGSWRLDIRENVLAWSDENYRIFGIPKGTQLTYETFLATVHPDDREYVDAQWKAGLRGEPYDIEHRILVESRIKWVRERAYLEFDQDGKLFGGFGITQDITERKLTEEQIQRSLKEKEVLLKEIHHRVKNNLQVVQSLLNLQANSTTDKAVRAIFEESRNRVTSMSLIHEKLYGSADLAHIDFKEYLQSLVTKIAETYHRTDVVISVEMESIALTVNVGIPCGLIVNELVSNSLKYAFPDERTGTIKIGINKNSEGNYVLSVFDNGIGFPETIDFSNTESLGLQLVNVLAGQINGTIEFSNIEGTQFSITFPGQEEK